MPYTTTAKQFIEGGKLQDLLGHPATSGLKALIKLAISGDDGGTWYYDVGDKKLSKKSTAKPSCIIEAQDIDFMALVEGRMSPSDGMITERLHVAGDTTLVTQIGRAHV